MAQYFIIKYKTDSSYPSQYNAWISNISAPAQFHANKWIDDLYNPTEAAGEYESWYGFWKLSEHIGGNAVLESGARAACDAWRQDYSVVNSYAVNGIQNYTIGFAYDWTNHANTGSRDAVLGQATSAGYAVIDTPLSNVARVRTREYAYATESYINAEVHCGSSHREKLDDLIVMFVGDINNIVSGDNYGAGSVTLTSGGLIEQFLGNYTTDINGNYVSGTHNFTGGGFIASSGDADAGFSPAIEGSTMMWSLRHYYDEAPNINSGIVPDSRIIPKMERLCDAIWNNYWIEEDSSLKYRWNTGTAFPGEIITGGSPDLNNLIFPIYSWLYFKTGTARHRVRAELLFNGSLDSYGFFPEVGAAKQFGELTRWTFDGLQFYTSGVILYG